MTSTFSRTTAADRFVVGHVAGVDRGPVTGDPVLLLNGLGLAAETWAHQIAALVGQGRRVVAVDRRGHGRSPYRPVSRFTELVDDVVAALDHLDLGPVDVCGLSMGGTEAVGLAAARPDRVRRLVLADTFVALAPEVAHERMAGMRRLLASHGMAGLAGAVVDGMLHVSPPPAERRALVDAFVDLGEYAFFQLMGVLYQTRLTAELAAVEVPTLVLAAEYDTRTPPASMRALAETVRDGRLVELRGAGHFPHLERPDEFSAALSDFLAG